MLLKPTNFLGVSRTGGRKNEPCLAERRRVKPWKCEKTKLNAHVHYNPLHVIISMRGNNFLLSSIAWGNAPLWMSTPGLRVATPLKVSLELKVPDTSDVASQWIPKPNLCWSFVWQGRFEGLFGFMGNCFLFSLDYQESWRVERGMVENSDLVVFHSLFYFHRKLRK